MYKVNQIKAYSIQITILQSSCSKHEQFGKKCQLYTCTKDCRLLGLSRNETHPDT